MRDCAKARYCTRAPPRARPRARAVRSAHEHILGEELRTRSPCLSPIRPIRAIRPSLLGVLNYVFQNPSRPWLSGGISGSGDWLRPGCTEAGLVAMEEIGILVEKAQVREGEADLNGMLSDFGIQAWV